MNSPSKALYPVFRVSLKVACPVPHGPFIRAALTFGLTGDSKRNSFPSHVPVSGSSMDPHATPRTVSGPVTVPVPSGASSTTAMECVYV